MAWPRSVRRVCPQLVGDHVVLGTVLTMAGTDTRVFALCTKSCSAGTDSRTSRNAHVASHFGSHIFNATVNSDPEIDSCLLVWLSRAKVLLSSCDTPRRLSNLHMFHVTVDSAPEIVPCAKVLLSSCDTPRRLSNLHMFHVTVDSAPEIVPCLALKNFSRNSHFFNLTVNSDPECLALQLRICSALAGVFKCRQTRKSHN